MKRIILIVAILAVAVGEAFYFTTKPGTVQPPPTAAPAADAADSRDASEGQKPKVAQAAKREMRRDETNAGTLPVAPTAGSVEAIAFMAAIDTMVSPHATYAERQAALKQLQDSGRLADAAAELEQRKAADPNNALYPTALGEAYLRLCATSTDVRAQAIWAMTADTDFEAALKLDPTDWDARLTKTVAMTYWPDNLNKGGEIIAQFKMLIQQQEQAAPQPEFAQTYEWLGKQYQKSGQTDAAQQVWQRGASLFPQNPSLQNLLAGSGAGTPAPQ